VHCGRLSKGDRLPAKTKRDEEKWQKAKDIAAEAGQAENYAYVMGIYKKMKPDYFKTATIPETDQRKVIDFLVERAGRPIPDSEVHSLAEEMGVEVDDLESFIYGLAAGWAKFTTAAVNPGGRAEEKGVTEEDFAPEAVAKGIEVELEHTRDLDLAKKIALDHLAEFEDYYEGLEEMEARLAEKHKGKKADWTPGELRDDTFQPGSTEEAPDPKGDGSQVPPPRTNDGEELSIEEEWAKLARRVQQDPPARK
jgi:hypothetical protein